MQNIAGMYRCPWTSTEREDRARDERMLVVTCAWPLTVPRRVIGLPDPNTDDRVAPP